ncbi:MAG: roadblock/LC7 domain-containing protein [Gemmatimonadota bacterium]|jgi:predicted regulator of Ras-like GTPase activity (Roadblock/LC7/MglB family)|nr:roadblock/LC7 domain-containing protein [Gemmatimonadota bacterium]
MSQLDAELHRLGAHAGVDLLVLLGRDGLVIQSTGSGNREEPVAARIPGLVSACEALGRAGETGDFGTAVLDYPGGGVLIVTVVAEDLLLAALVRSDMGFGPLLREMRSARGRLPAFL